MITKFKKTALFFASLGLFASFVLAPAVQAIDITETGDADTSILKNENDSGGDFATIVGNVISTLLFILGIAAVIIIIIGGIKFATANGDPGAVKSARNTILYAVVGLIAAILAYVIVQFVTGAFTSE